MAALGWLRMRFIIIMTFRACNRCDHVALLEDGSIDSGIFNQTRNRTLLMEGCCLRTMGCCRSYRHRWLMDHILLMAPILCWLDDSIFALPLISWCFWGDERCAMCRWVSIDQVDAVIMVKDDRDSRIARAFLAGTFPRLAVFFVEGGLKRTTCGYASFQLLI